MSDSLIHRPQTAKDRESRRVRIITRVQAGYSYSAIGREEGLSRERVRQIVGETVEKDAPSRVDMPRVQTARLEPALRLAAEAVAEGQLTAIAPLLKILAQLDKYGATFQRVEPQDENSHAKLMAKINRAFRRSDEEWERKRKANEAAARTENSTNWESTLTSPTNP